MALSPDGRWIAASANGTTIKVWNAQTAQEFQVLRGLAEGEPLKSIARRLEVSPKTVTTYRTRIFQKLSLRTNAELVRYAIEHQLLTHN